MKKQNPREIRYIPVSTDPGRMYFFGNLMPAILLMKKSPFQLITSQVAKRYCPDMSAALFINRFADDFAYLDGTYIFLHQWNSLDFDPVVFARAKIFLKRVARLLEKEGYWCAPLDPISPHINLPKLAVKAGLGNLSPFELLVHPNFGPRLIITGIRTNYPFNERVKKNKGGCTSCMICIEKCPQRPIETGEIILKECLKCTQCFEICPVGVV